MYYTSWIYVEFDQNGVFSRFFWISSTFIRLCWTRNWYGSQSQSQSMVYVDWRNFWKAYKRIFDFICGVSIGAILGFAIGHHNRSLDEIARHNEDISKQSSLKGTRSLAWSHVYKDTVLWDEKLKQHLGNEKLISTARNPKCHKFCAISAIASQEHLSVFVFRNYSLLWKFQSQYTGVMTLTFGRRIEPLQQLPPILKNIN